MKVSAHLKTVLPLFLWLALFSVSAHAQVDGSGVFDNVLGRYSTAAASWAGTITQHASWLFWTLVVISMVWTFGMMALRKADIGEFFAELVKFTIFTGFFWWLLTNGPAFSSSIYASLRQIAGNATGLGSGLSPSGIVDIGFAIFDKVLDQSTVWSPVDSAIGIIMATVILVILALVGVNMLLLLVAGWVLAYGGVFFLGFGGGRWTSDIAINYYKTVLGVAAQLMAMVLLVGIGKTFLDDYYTRMSTGISLKEMGVMLIVVIILLALVNKIPALLTGIITGASIGGAGIGSFGAGAAMGAAGMAVAAAATGGAALAAGAASAAGGASAIQAAFQKAHATMSAGSDIPSLGSVVNGDSNGGSDVASTNSKSGGGSFTKASKLAISTASELAKGASVVAKAKAGSFKDSAMERIADTTGGKIAAAIKASSGNTDTAAYSPENAISTPIFEGNSLASGNNSTADPESEIAAFVNRDNGEKTG